MMLTHAVDAESLAAPSLSVTLGSGRIISKTSLFIVLQTGGWAAAYLVCAIASQQQQGLWPALFDTSIWALSGFLISLALHHIYRDLRRRKLSYAVITPLALAVSVLLAPLWYFVQHVSLRLVLPAVLHIEMIRSFFVADAAATMNQPLLLTAYLWPFYAIILFTWASLYFGINAILELESERANVVTALKLADRARLSALQSNLNPHFLFNALNGIATLVREQDSVTAVAMIDALSNYLRSTVRRLDTPELRVEEELELIHQYLRIQRFRFGARLQTTVESEPAAMSALVPTLILQPLVENALRHGVLPRETGGSLRVSVRTEREDLVMTVEDDGPGLQGGTVSAYGVGLQNSSDRLNALYGAAASLTIGSRADSTGCAVVIRLPFRSVPVIQTTDAELVALTA